MSEAYSVDSRRHCDMLCRSPFMHGFAVSAVGSAVSLPSDCLRDKSYFVQDHAPPKGSHNQSLINAGFIYLNIFLKPGHLIPKGNNLERSFLLQSSSDYMSLSLGLQCNLISTFSQFCYLPLLYRC